MSKTKDIKFNIKERTIINIGKNNAIIYDIINNDDIEYILTKRGKEYGYIEKESILPVLIVYNDIEDNDCYVSLLTTNDKQPIFICNKFKYNKDTVIKDLTVILEQWLGMSKLKSIIKRIVNPNKYRINENEDEITITIKK